MFHIGRGLVGLLAAGACVALVGCWEKDGRTSHEDGPAAGQSAARAQELAEKRRQALQGYHDSCVEVFVRAQGFGQMRMPTLTHTKTEFPKSLFLPAPSGTDAAGQPLAAAPVPWVMDKVELVGLLYSEKPGVYPADTPMNKKFAIRRPRTRDLDDFEKEALTGLQKGESIRVSEVDASLRVLGAIRSRQECKKCHDKPDGALLGAFTYVFRPGEGPAKE